MSSAFWEGHPTRCGSSLRGTPRASQGPDLAEPGIDFHFFRLSTQVITHDIICLLKAPSILLLLVPDKQPLLLLEPALGRVRGGDVRSDTLQTRLFLHIETVERATSALSHDNNAAGATCLNPAAGHVADEGGRAEVVAVEGWDEVVVHQAGKDGGHDALWKDAG